jgi:hypothetical protein
MIPILIAVFLSKLWTIAWHKSNNQFYHSLQKSSKKEAVKSIPLSIQMTPGTFNKYTTYDATRNIFCNIRWLSFNGSSANRSSSHG